MGVQSLQDFVDSSPEKYTVKLPKVRGTPRVLEDASNTYLVHADSCIHLFYQHTHMDWVCGGQWNEFVNNVERFVRGFKTCSAELVIFIDGTMNSTKLFEWRIKNRLARENAKETLDLAQLKQQIPFKCRQDKFIPPGALKAALRLAFRSCNVMVCNAVNDVFRESVLFCKDLQLQGIIAKDANYILYGAPRYLSFSMVRHGKRSLESLRLYNIKEILESLHLPGEKLSIYASLLGNRFLSEKDLASFFWDLIDESSPLWKVKENLQSDVALPPPSLRLKCIAEFLQKCGPDINDIAQKVFAHSKSLSFEKGKDLLGESVEFYAEGLKASKSTRVPAKEKENLLISGYPIPEAVLKFLEKRRLEKEKSVLIDKGTKSVVADAPSIGEEISDPEKVLKEGTLEEAAKALEVLEQKESAAVLKEDEPIDCTSDDYVLISKEDVCIPAKGDVDDPSEEKTGSGNASQRRDSSEFILEVEEEHGFYPREIAIQSCVDGVPAEILIVTRKRHQTGQMCPEILHLLSKGEIALDMGLEDELSADTPPAALIYRPLRQLMYGILFSHKVPKIDHRTTSTSMNSVEVGLSASFGADVEVPNLEAADSRPTDEPAEARESSALSVFTVKEWCVYRDQDLSTPDYVTPLALSWGIPSLQKLWLGLDPEDNANRLKAFLSCMKSDTVNMSNTAMVPQRLLLLCCTLRYLIQHGSGKSLLSRQEIDAFVAQALSPFLTTENNVQNLANFKVGQLDPRGVRLAAIFMCGIENAIMANDACGSPVPWEFCCPWNFFDGKLFQSKWLQAMSNVSTVELCDGKPQVAAKLERIRWCITEGLDVKYAISGLQAMGKAFNPFGNSPSLRVGPVYGQMRPAGAHVPPIASRARSRGPGSKRLVHGSGGTLQVAGVPVAHWGGNKSGLGYSKNAPDVVVGGPESVDLPSSHRRGKRGMIRGTNRGRGLLETPYFSPWVTGFGLDDMVTSSYQNYMRGVQKSETGRPRSSQGKVHGSIPGLMNTGRMQQLAYQQQHVPQVHPPAVNSLSSPPVAGNGGGLPKHNETWLGKGRSQPKLMPPAVVAGVAEEFVGRGRGKWMNGE